MNSSGNDVFIKPCVITCRLGTQKYKSRTISNSKNPKWVEQFDLYLYEGQPQILEVQVFDELTSTKEYIGRCSIDVGLLEKEVTHHKTFPLQEGCGGDISFLLTISGTAGIESISDLAYYNPTEEEQRNLAERYVSLNCLHLLHHHQ